MAEVTHSFNTAQGKYDVIKYSNGAEHMYSVDDTGKHPDHLSHEDMIQAHHDPELQKQWDGEREEQARKAGEAAVEAASEEETSNEVHLGPALWHSRRNGDMKVEVLGPSEKYPGGINPRNGKLYVQVRTGKGTNYSNVLAENLESMGSSPIAEEAARSRVEGQRSEEQADAHAEKLEKIIPASEKGKKSPEQLITEMADRIQKRQDERLTRFEKALRLMAEGKNDEASRVLRGEAAEKTVDEDKKDAKFESWETADANGHKVKIVHDLENGTWRLGKNGGTTRTWFEVPEDQALSYGIDKDNPEHLLDEDPATDTDAGEKKQEDTTKEHRQKLAALTAELQDAPAERQKEILAEMEALQAQMKEALENQEETETKEISAEEARANSEQRTKSLWQRARDRWNRTKAALINGHANMVTGGPDEDAETSSTSTKVEVLDGEGNPVATQTEQSHTVERKEVDRRRRHRRLIGGLILAGVGVGAYFLGKHGVHVHEFCNGHNTGIGPDHIEHVEHFRGSYGHLRTGVELPGGLHLKHLATHDIIVNDQGHTVVGHLKEGIADKQGNLSHHAKEILRGQGFQITQNGLEGSDGVFRYMSEVS